MGEDRWQACNWITGICWFGCTVGFCWPYWRKFQISTSSNLQDHFYHRSYTCLSVLESVLHMYINNLNINCPLSGISPLRYQKLWKILWNFVGKCYVLFRRRTWRIVVLEYATESSAYVHEFEIWRALLAYYFCVYLRSLMCSDELWQALDRLPLIPDFFEIVGILFSGVISYYLLHLLV